MAVGRDCQKVPTGRIDVAQSYPTVRHCSGIHFGDIVPSDEANRNRLKRNDLVLTTGLETNSDIEPMSGYVADYLESAAEWSEEFRDDFVESTAANTGEPITKYLEYVHESVQASTDTKHQLLMASPWQRRHGMDYQT